MVPVKVNRPKNCVGVCDASGAFDASDAFGASSVRVNSSTNFSISVACCI